MIFCSLHLKNQIKIKTIFTTVTNLIYVLLYIKKCTFPFLSLFNYLNKLLLYIGLNNSKHSYNYTFFNFFLLSKKFKQTNFNKEFIYFVYKKPNYTKFFTSIVQQLYFKFYFNFNINVKVFDLLHNLH